MVISFVRRTAFARSVLDTLRCTQPVSKTKFCFILKKVLFKNYLDLTNNIVRL